MSDVNSQNKTIARNTVLLSLRMVIVLGFTFYTTRVLLNLLGIVDFGVYNVVCGFVSLFAFLNSAMTNGTQRFYNYELGKNGVEGARYVFNASFLIQVIVAFCIILLTETIGLWYLHNKIVIPEGRSIAAEWIYHFSILSLVFVIFQAPFSAAVLANEKMDFFAVVNVLDTILKLCVVLLLVHIPGDSLILYGALLALISLLDLIIYASYAFKKFEEVCITKVIIRPLFNSMLSFSGWNIFGSLAGIARDQGLSLVLNFFCGPVANAASGIATQVYGGVQSLVSNLTIAVRPQVIQSYAQGNVERTMTLTFSISKISGAVLLLISLPIIFEIDYILHLWLGNSNVPQNTSDFVIVILLISFISNLNQAISGVVHASGKMCIYQINGGFFAVIAVFAAYFSLLNGGAPIVVYICSLLCMTISQLFSLLILKKIVYFRLIDYFTQVIIPLFAIFLIITPFLYIANCYLEGGLMRLCLIASLSILIGSPAVYLVGLNRKERALVSSFINNKIKR